MALASQPGYFKLRVMDSSMNRPKLKTESWIDYLKPSHMQRKHISIDLMFFHQLVVTNALVYYSPTLFESMNLDFNTRLAIFSILNAIQLIGVASLIFAVDRIGRPSLFLWGLALTFISHLIIAFLVGNFSDNPSRIFPSGQ